MERIPDEITLDEDYLDSRDIIARIEWLEDEAEDQAEQEELEMLRAFAEEAEQYSPDWEYGTSLINDAYFEEFAEGFAEDIGALSDSGSWPNYCIDWGWAARELQFDYSLIIADNDTEYWLR